MDQLVPYEIPKQDRDLWGCGKNFATDGSTKCGLSTCDNLINPGDDRAIWSAGYCCYSHYMRREAVRKCARSGCQNMFVTLREQRKYCSSRECYRERARLKNAEKARKARDISALAQKVASEVTPGDWYWEDDFKSKIRGILRCDGNRAVQVLNTHRYWTLKKVHPCSSLRRVLIGETAHYREFPETPGQWRKVLDSMLRVNDVENAALWLEHVNLKFAGLDEPGKFYIAGKFCELRLSHGGPPDLNQDETEIIRGIKSYRDACDEALRYVWRAIGPGKILHREELKELILKAMQVTGPTPRVDGAAHIMTAGEGVCWDFSPVHHKWVTR